MKILDEAQLFGPDGPSAKQEPGYTALVELFEGQAQQSWSILRKVIAGRRAGKRAAFCVIQGKVGSMSFPWLIVDKKPALVNTGFKQAKAAIRGVRGAKKEVFFKGNRFVRGSVQYEHNRLVFRIDEGTLSAGKLDKLFARAYRVLDDQKAVKRMLVLLRDALVLDVGEELDEADASLELPAPVDLSEIIGEADADDLEVLANLDWSVGLEDEDSVEVARAQTAAELFDELDGATSREERAEAWLEYRRTASQTPASRLGPGDPVDETAWVDAHMAQLNACERLNRRLQRTLDARDQLLDEAESAAPDAQTFERFSAMGEQLDTLGARLDGLLADVRAALRGA